MHTHARGGVNKQSHVIPEIFMIFRFSRQNSAKNTNLLDCSVEIFTFFGVFMHVRPKHLKNIHSYYFYFNF